MATMRKLEMYCDGVTVITLLRLGRDANAYARPRAADYQSGKARALGGRAPEASLTKNAS